MVRVVPEAVVILSSKARISKDKVEAAVQTDKTRMDSRISRTDKALVVREVSNRMVTKTRMEMVVAHLQLRSPINLAMTATNSLVAVLDNKEISRNPVRMVDKISNLETGSRTVSPEIRMVRTNKAMTADSLAIISKMAREISKVLAILPDGSTGAPCGACRELMVQLMPECYKDKGYKDIEIMLDYASGRTVKLGEITPAWWI